MSLKALKVYCISIAIWAIPIITFTNTMKRPILEIADKDVKDLLFEVASKWEELGSQFGGFTHNTFDEIKQSHPHDGPKTWMHDMITRRRKNTDLFRWSDVAEALRNIECHDVAEKICRQYKTRLPRVPAGKFLNYSIAMTRLRHGHRSWYRRSRGYGTKVDAVKNIHRYVALFRTRVHVSYYWEAY